MTNTTLLLAVLPLVLIDLGLIIFTLVDLYRRDSRTVRGSKKWPWVLIILLVSTLGPIIYLVAGRTEGEGY
jgi:glucose uptake protein GlcU